MGTLGTEYATHLRRRGLAAGTIYRRSSTVRAFREWLDGVPLEAATTQQVERFLDSRGLEGRTRYCWISHLHCFYRWAIDHGHATQDPTARIERPRLRRLMPRPIGEPDLEVALSMADRTMKAWLALASYGGLRCAEIAALDADCVLHQYGVLRVLGKGAKERMVPMHPVVSDALAAYGVPRSGPVFRRPRGVALPGGDGVEGGERLPRVARDLGDDAPAAPPVRDGRVPDEPGSAGHAGAARSLVADDDGLLRGVLGAGGARRRARHRVGGGSGVVAVRLPVGVGVGGVPVARRF